MGTDDSEDISQSGADGRFVQQPRTDIDRQHSAKEKELEDEVTSLGKKVSLDTCLAPGNQGRNRREGGVAVPKVIQLTPEQVSGETIRRSQQPAEGYCKILIFLFTSRG